MRKIKIIVGLAFLVLALIAGWQIAACELANLELQSDLRDLAAQAGARIGLNAVSSDEELRADVILKDKEHEIQLEPEQVTVQRLSTGSASTVYLAADYKARVNLLGYSFTLHFIPSSRKKVF